MTDWKEYTPAIAGFTGTLDTFMWRRVGDSISIKGTSSTTTVLASAFSFSLPSGLSVDSSKNPSKTNSASHGVLYNIEGSVAGAFASSTKGPFVVFSDTSVSSSLLYAAQDTVGSGLSADDGNEMLTAGGRLRVDVSNIPILGWSSNAVSSEDLGGREIVVEGAGNGGTSITIDVTDIDFTETRDTTSSWSGSSFIVPETGDYKVDGAILFTADAIRNVRIYVDTVYRKAISGTTQKTLHGFSGTVSLVKGDSLTIRVGSNGGTLLSSITAHHIHIQKLASPQTILETETVAARYTSNSGQSFTSGVFTPVIFEDLNYDTHNAMDTGTGYYTVPVSGYYSVKSTVSFGDATISAGQNIRIQIRNGGTALTEKIVEYTGTNSAAFAPISEATDYYFTKGDTININLGNYTTNNETLFADGTFNHISIHRIK